MSEVQAAQFPISIKLERNSKGYNWEIKCGGDNEDELLDRLQRLDGRLRVKYGQE